MSDTRPGSASSAPAAAGTSTVSSFERLRTPLTLLSLGVIWGASFLFMRIAVGDFGTFALVEVRLALGTLVLLPFLWRERARFTRARLVQLIAIGAINSAVPFALFAWATARAPAGIAAISNATTVMFTALIAVLFFGERMNAQRVLGVLAGFAGVVVLANDKTSGDDVWQAALACTFAAFMYGIGSNLTRRYLADLPAGAVAAATLGSATLLLGPFAIATWPEITPPLASWTSAVLLGVVCTGFAYLMYYQLIFRIGAPRSSTVTYLVPLFGVLWAWGILDEPLTPAMAAAGLLILGGVALSQRPLARPIAIPTSTR